MRNYISQFILTEDGATAIEYSLIAALISVVIILAVSSVGVNLGSLYKVIVTGLIGP
jgi:pilus assembly protein Flp/PilA